MSIEKRIALRNMNKLESKTAEKVAASYTKKKARDPGLDESRMDGKIVGKDARLFWSRDTFYMVNRHEY